MPKFPEKLFGLLSACSLLALLPSVVLAQGEVPAEQPKPEIKLNPDDPQIVVIGNRTIIASLKDVKVEQTYDADRAQSYGASTVGELLDNLSRENGDSAPSLLVNGQPVGDLGDISDFPVEAISRIEALPRGAASRVGGTAGQRAYNVVLRSSVKSLTATASGQFATEGDWRNYKGEALATYIKGQDRVNLTFRRADSDFLFNSDRNITPLAESIPFAAAGNIIPQFGTEIDPLLSAIAGRPVNTVALRSDILRPTLANLIDGANAINPSNVGDFRTLRGANTPYELSVAGNKTLASWLALSFNGRLNWSQTTSQSGLPSARFLIPADNLFTPFSRPAIIAINDPVRPLQNVSNSTNGSVSATLNANFGGWRGTVLGRYDEQERKYSNERVGVITGGLITVDPTTNPFAGTLAGLIPINKSLTRSKTKLSQISGDLEGPLFSVPAGSVRLRAGGAMAWSNLDASGSSSSNDRSFRRREFTVKAGVTLPITGGDGSSGFMPVIGRTEISVDGARLDLGRFGDIDRYSVALNWEPLDWLNFSASQAKDGFAVAPELLSAPTIVNDNVSFFDPLTGETADVTIINGGAANLRNQTQRVKTLSATARPWQKYNLQLNASYLVTRVKNQIGALPPPSTAVVVAFPERFQRDSSGRLIVVDNRTVNFARQNSRELRTGVGFTVPLSQNVPGSPRPAGRRAGRINLQVNASHTFLLESETVIRDGLGVVDLLDGGAIGIGGGRQRNVSDASIALTQGGTGVRLNAARRGASFLRTGSVASPDLLTFEPVTKVDLRAYVDIGAFAPKSKFAKGTKLTVAMENLTNSRQRVTNSAGAVPISYQPGYVDPIGRTVMVEIRKVF
ncbi:hypothetical protein [Sphingorhabdus sp.]|uniref:hypothetical protein n=1 Tax=Sphingorhabdus sp. TaxID=1902408 RepID=UPI003918FF63